MDQSAYVYIVTNRKNGTLYVGVTTDLVKRIGQHKQGDMRGFTQRYRVKQLVYFSVFPDLETAQARERALKKWRRSWKIELIENANPNWRDLYPDIIR